MLLYFLKYFVIVKKYFIADVAIKPVINNKLNRYAIASDGSCRE